MIFLVRGGNRAAALAQYEAYRRMLAAELALVPAPETTALYEQIRAGASFELSVLSSELNSRQLGTPNSELRAQRLEWSDAPEVQHFYGREAELAKLYRWVVD
jgi:DNA-binding SARP family transcriptional activator